MAEGKQLKEAEPEGSRLPASTVTMGYRWDTGVQEGREEGGREGKMVGEKEGREGKELEELFSWGILTGNLAKAKMKN